MELPYEAAHKSRKFAKGNYCGGEMTETSPVIIAAAADGKYALPLAVMLRSAVGNLNPSRLSIFGIPLWRTKRGSG
ncbi:MAG: hypothetical protein ACXWG0_01805, partial [Chthoniobacterales bacterium]